eukprot:TRINITY_DN8984_c0_g2_i4.p1 TRINITY_DN8984_c0_g2~~TRINITY_DN8984_c0_g2_i4.p1  ORF type:complete len:320 (+),score=60.69 TRINITY_DN8984_c0_g2_i4:131-1090(+)
MEPTEEEQALCDEDGTVAKIWCDDCTKLLCEKCDEQIHVGELYSTHNRADLNGSDEIALEVEEEEFLSIEDRKQDPFDLCSSLFLLSVASLKDQSFESLSLSSAEELLTRGWTHFDLNPTDSSLDIKYIAESLNAEVIKLQEEGKLKRAGAEGNDALVRGDVTTWIHVEDEREGKGLLPSSSALRIVLEQITVLERDFKKIISLQGEVEVQVAYYSGTGIGYSRHRDAYPVGIHSDNTLERRLTVIFYSNPTWSTENGGALRIFLEPREKLSTGLEHISEGYHDVEPISGRIVVFLSGVVEHEVLPVFGPRVAVTSWYR